MLTGFVTFEMFVYSFTSSAKIFSVTASSKISGKSLMY